MIKFNLNPFEMIIETVTELYGEIDADVQFAPIEKKKDKCVGFTTFFDNGKPPLISISGNIPFYATIEIFAHELAHVIVGIKSGHGKKWEKIFERIHKGYIKKIKKLHLDQK